MDEKQPKSTQFAISADGTRIAYDVTGKGPALLLLHGGGHNRQRWYEAGYIERLKEEFAVIAVDARGHGESDKPTEPAAYTTGKLCQDLLAVADACVVERFMIWGYSYGGNLARYLAAESDRVVKFILIGIPFGPGAAGEFRQSIEDFRAHWAPILQAQRAGALDVASLSEDDRHYLEQGNTPMFLAWLSAMLDWRAIEPADLRCPTLWLVGSDNEGAMATIKDYEMALQGSNVQVQVLEGLDHEQEFSEIEKVLPVMLAFTKAH